jgi:hypothetical protein
VLTRWARRPSLLQHSIGRRLPHPSAAVCGGRNFGPGEAAHRGVGRAALLTCFVVVFGLWFCCVVSDVSMACNNVRMPRPVLPPRGCAEGKSHHLLPD